MSNETLTVKSNATYIIAFGKKLQIDSLNTVDQIDNSTVVIKPRYNITGLKELKIGVLLPFSQTNDNLTAEIVWGGSSAIRMAVNTINQQRLISGAYITLVQKDSFPNKRAGDQGAVTEAVYASATLLQQGVIAVIGDISSSWTALSALMTSTLEIPQCSFTANAVGFSDKSQFKYFYRTIPTKTTLADVMLDFVSSQKWVNIGVIYSNDILGQQFYQKIMNIASYKKLNVIGYQPFFPDDITGCLEFISSSTIRIILVGVTGADQVKLITEAAKKNLLSNQYVWLLMDDNSPSIIEAAGELSNRNLLNGLFFFDMKISLNGYPPFESFLDEWVKLDPKVYPYAGRRNVTTNEGPAYSCMMTMARGFNRTLSNVGNHTLGLEMLSNRSLGSSMTPTTFDTGYISPEGPLHYDNNGDLTRGNHHIYNLQNGVLVSIGQSIAGNLELTKMPMFHDGTFQPPIDSPPSRTINPTFSDPGPQALLIFTVTCMLLTVLVLFLVILYRKHEIFRASSPLFSCLELVGFILSYFSVILMIGIPTQTSCFVVPITFTLGLLLVLGNLIAKNYRIYRIFNNVFISKSVMTDSKLMKTTSVVVLLDMAILIIGLIVTQPTPKFIKLNATSHYWTCEAQSSPITKTIFLSIGLCYAGAMLTFATFLAYKTRSAGKSYDHFNECKQMGISVYNILFSAIVGFTAIVNPLANYYTRFYFIAGATLWGTTFSFAVLFIPKVYIFYKQWKQNFKLIHRHHRQNSNFTQNTLQDYSLDDGETTVHSFLRSNIDNSEFNKKIAFNIAAGNKNYTSAALLGELSTAKNNSVKRMYPGGPVTSSSSSNSVSPTETNHCYDSSNVYVEVQEGDVPIRKAFRYFPFLSQWKMRRLMIFPRLKYISYYSEQSKRGTMVSYSHASVYRANPEEYVLKVHGKDVHDVFIQLGDFITMESWQACLNQDIMKQQQQMTKGYINSPTTGKSAPSVSSYAVQQNQSIDQQPTIIEEDRIIYEEILNDNNDKVSSEVELLSSTLSNVPYTGRRRSKSHPSILSQSSIDEELLNKYPLLCTTALLSPQESNAELSPINTQRKRRKTFNYDTD